MKSLSSLVNSRLLGNNLTLPNVITGVRLLAAPVVFYLVVTGLNRMAFWVFLFAGASDFMDGYIARLYKTESPLGKILDPIADKVLLIGVCVALSLSKIMPWWLSGVIIVRDLLIVGGVFVAWLFNLTLILRPHLIGKLNTVLQITLCLLLLGRDFLPWITTFEDYLEIFVYCTLSTTVLSGMIYARIFYQSYQSR
ncbi:MAG: CDP-alcohol phosphatidyltransferase family protein [Alphaproteobacteria bacterium]|nr:CDP-alcohol phosphatidyltransferase family protein [Alphaproteobacteria bacterium]